jgi:DNA-binding SARP family transcriptional activator
VSGLRVSLFGEVAIERDDRPVPCPANKPAELFCYLLVHRDRPHTRERLSDLLWPGEPEPASRRYLRQALWRLSTALAGPDGTGEAAVCTGSGWLRANLDAVEWLDVATFESVQSATRDSDGSALGQTQAAALEDAVGLHRGDLLASWQQDWCQVERSRLQQAQLAMREQLMAYYETRRQYPHGIHHGLAVLRHDPARETTHRRLMRLHYRAGDRTAAIRQFQACTAALDSELGVVPSAATNALYQQICADRLNEPRVRLFPAQAPPDVEARPEPRPGEDGWLELLHDRLDAIQASLNAVQRMIARAGSMALDGAVTRDAG